METLALSRLEPGIAAAMLAAVPRLERLDPRGIATRGDLAAMCEGGACFAATTASGAQAVYVLRVRGGQAWIEAAAGVGAADLTAVLLPAIELQASELSSVAFQTARPGLVRKAKALGYTVRGWIMKKDLR